MDSKIAQSLMPFVLAFFLALLIVCLAGAIVGGLYAVSRLETASLVATPTAGPVTPSPAATIVAQATDTPPAAATATPVATTPVPPTATGTPVIVATAAPTATSVPPTSTPVPPTDTPVPTDTPTPPPGPTDTPPPTPTPTNTPIPTPAAPSSFTAAGTGTTIKFTWIDNSTNEWGFRIYQVGVVAPVVTLGSHAATGGMSYAWTGRPCNTTATYYVRAYNAAGESTSSNKDGAVTIPCSPTGFNATGASQSTVNVSFTDNATNESGFRIYRTGYGTPLATLSAHSGTGTKTGTVSNIICGQVYSYYAKAYNSAGESPASNTNDATTYGCTVAVNFTKVHVYNDEDPIGPGEIWFFFTVNGSTKRWPSLGTVAINSGETKALSGISYTFNLYRTQDLTIKVTGEDEDTYPDADDSLGAVNTTYTSGAGFGNWAEGDHEFLSSRRAFLC
ncbi:MAG: fibronectin type III domain-containing protein [Chloroflexota bacterium]